MGGLDCPIPIRKAGSFGVRQFVSSSGVKEVGAHLIYHVDKGLRVVCREASDHLDLIVVREDS